MVADALAVDPTRPSTVYASFFDGLFATKDGGQSWVRVLSEDVHDIAFDPLDPGTVYVDSSEGVAASSDRGKTWVRRSDGLPGAFVVQVASDPNDPDRIMAADGNNGVDITVDRGSTWHPSNSGLAFKVGRLVAFDPFDPNTMYASLGFIANEHDGPYRTTDGGKTWIEASRGIHAGSFIYALIADPSREGTLFASGNAGSSVLYRPDDHGDHWAAITGLPSKANILAMAFDPTSPSTVYAGLQSLSNVNVYKSVDGGTTWLPMGNGLPTSYVKSIAIGPDDGAVYVVSGGNAVYESTDGGATWTNRSTGIASTELQQISINPALPSELAVMNQDPADVYVSNDRADTWSRVAAKHGWDLGYGVTFDRDGRMLVATDAGVFTLQRG